jgi:hypothetical protein
VSDVARASPARASLAAALDPVPTLGVPEGFTEGRTPAEVRFLVGRAVAALLDARLVAAHRAEWANAGAEAGPPSVLHVELAVLDRAGLLLAGDPAVALRHTGAQTLRGRALTEFALSDEIFERWGELGLGLGR